MSARTDNPLAFALGALSCAVVIDLFFIGGHALAWVINWQHGRQSA